jgi:hypothetical protein
VSQWHVFHYNSYQKRHQSHCPFIFQGNTMLSCWAVRIGRYLILFVYILFFWRGEPLLPSTMNFIKEGNVSFLFFYLLDYQKIKN